MATTTKKTQLYKDFKASRNLVREVKLVSDKSTPTYEPKAIKCSEDAYKFICQFYESDITLYESVFVLLLNHSNTTIGFAKISQGGITQSVVDNKIIAKYAIDSLATGIILAHNHPSGNKRPSSVDLIATEKLTKALQLIDVSLTDHLIITEDDYYSLADNGQL